MDLFLSLFHQRSEGYPKGLRETKSVRGLFYKSEGFPKDVRAMNGLQDMRHVQYVLSFVKVRTVPDFYLNSG